MNPNIEISFASPERPGPQGYTRCEITCKFNPELVSAADVESMARRCIGKDINVPGRTYVAESYRFFGDNLIFTVTRESDQVLAERARAEQKRREDLQREVYAGLEHLVNTDPDMLAKMLAGSLVSYKASTRFKSL